MLSAIGRTRAERIRYPSDSALRAERSHSALGAHAIRVPPGHPKPGRGTPKPGDAGQPGSLPRAPRILTSDDMAPASKAAEPASMISDMASRPIRKFGPDQKPGRESNQNAYARLGSVPALLERECSETALSISIRFLHSAAPNLLPGRTTGAHPPSHRSSWRRKRSRAENPDPQHRGFHNRPLMKKAPSLEPLTFYGAGERT